MVISESTLAYAIMRCSGASHYIPHQCWLVINISCAIRMRPVFICKMSLKVTFALMYIEKLLLFLTRQTVGCNFFGIRFRVVTPRNAWCNQLWSHQQNVKRVSDTPNRCVRIVFLSSFAASSCNVRDKIMNLVSWWSVIALTWVGFCCLIPSLHHDIKHIILSVFIIGLTF